MDVLVLESEPGAAELSIALLEAAGHQVKRCHEQGARAYPCVALDSGHCPLEEGSIDVVLTVRGHANPRPSSLEDGVTCALRRRTPVVVAGSTVFNPFEQFGASNADGDVVAACEAAADGRQRGHEAVVRRVLRDALQRANLGITGMDARVHRSGDGLKIGLVFPPTTPKPVRDVASVCVVGAVREFDPHAPRIDISCVDD